MDEKNGENSIMRETKVFSEVSTNDSGSESELTLEEREKFEKLMKDLAKTDLSFFNFKPDYDEFTEDLTAYDSVGKQLLLNKRRFWLEMKRGGDAFKKFFTDDIHKLLEAGDGDAVFKHLLIYETLGYKDSANFLGEALDHKTIWGDIDGSSVTEIIGFLENNGDRGSVEKIINFIGHACSDDYQRKMYLAADLSKSTRALARMLGADELKSTLDGIAQKNPAFSDFIKGHTYLGPVMNDKKAKIIVEEFDAPKEEERLRFWEEKILSAKTPDQDFKFLPLGDLPRNYPDEYRDDNEHYQEKQKIHQAEVFFKVSTGDSGTESELTAEERETFRALLSRTVPDCLPFRNFYNWEGFYSELTSFFTDTDKQEILKARWTWLEMKKNGDKFRDFLFGETLKLLEQPRPDGGLIYSYLQIIQGLGYKDKVSIEFLGKMLNHKAVWTDNDGSTVHDILGFMGGIQDSNVKDAVLRYINDVFSEDYPRKSYIDVDLRYAVRALHAALGDRTVGLLRSLAEKDQTFSGWLEKSKLVNDIVEMITPPGKWEFDEFDYVKETRRLSLLQSGKPDEGKSSGGVSREIGAAIEPIKPTEPRIRFFENNYLLDLQAGEWERGKLINFYGRFGPELKKSIDLTADNYISSLFAQGLRVEVLPESCLNFLSGAATESDAEFEIPDKITPDQAYRTAALAYARSLCLGLLDGKKEEAVSEINSLKELLIRFAEKATDPGEREFFRGLSYEMATASSFIKNNESSLAGSELPQSADSFLMYHYSFDKTRQIPDFKILLAEKIRWYLSQDLFHNFKNIRFSRHSGGITGVINGPSFERIRGIVGQYTETTADYLKVENGDTPLYWEAKERLEELGGDRMVVFGRDGRYFFSALKASEFGKKDRKVLKYVIVTRPITKEGSADKADRELIANYLQQNGVSLDFTFIDTGFRGSIPEFAIKCLAEAGGVELAKEEIDKRIKLLASSHDNRRELSRRRINRQDQESLIGKIEDYRPKNIDTPNYLTMDEKGKIKPETRPFPVDQQMRAWAIEHVVMRNFAPRLDEKKRRRYYQASPLRDFTFIQEYRGSHIGTHPMQLWENNKREKVLLKGGPEHTLRADFLGQKILEMSGVKTPKSELIRTDEGLKLKMEYLEGWKTGGLKLPAHHHNNKSIQGGLLADSLLGQYDRTPWNIMFSETDNVAFIDNGAGLTSRARGGHKGFPDNFDTNQLKEILSNPQFTGQPVNEAYANLVEVEGDKIKIKDPSLLRRMVEVLRIISARDIDAIIDGVFADGERSIAAINKLVLELKNELSGLSKGSADHKKTKGAIETYQKMISFGGEASYLKHALRQRRFDIIRLFETALESSGP